jgi:hypothetical protein
MYCQRKIINYSLIIILSFFSSVSIAGLNSFTVSYKIESLGITQANATNSLNSDGNHYRFESHIKPVGWIGIINNADRYEYSEGLIKDKFVIPEKYSYQHSQRLSDDRHVEVIFDNSKHKITNIHKHINNKWKMDSVEHVQDRLSSQLSLMLALQQASNFIDKKGVDKHKVDKKIFMFPVADGGRIKQYSFKIIAEEKLETPVGTLNTIKLEHHRSNQDEVMIIWCAEEFAYLPVKIYQQQSGAPDYISIIDSYTKN